MRTRHTVLSKTRPQLWLRAGSILISFAAVTLLATAFSTHFYSRSLSVILLALVLIALCVAIALHVRFLLLVRREHRETASAFDATEREYKSVFGNALDGILILDDQGVCLEANPAALDLLGAGHNELVGGPIGKFYAGPGDFKGVRRHFLAGMHTHGEVRLVRGDGEAVFVEYTAKADYLPGRHVAAIPGAIASRDLPTFLLEPRIRSVEPGIGVIGELAREFSASLTASARRFVEVTSYRCAVVWSTRDRIRWYARSKEFGHHVNVGESVDRNSLAYKCLFEGQRQAGPLPVPADSWLPEHNLLPDARLLEESLFLPFYESALSLLWITERIEKRTEWDEEEEEVLDPNEFTLARRRWPRK